MEGRERNRAFHPEPAVSVHADIGIELHGMCRIGIPIGDRQLHGMQLETRRRRDAPIFSDHAGVEDANCIDMHGPGSLRGRFTRYAGRLLRSRLGRCAGEDTRHIEALVRFQNAIQVSVASFDRRCAQSTLRIREPHTVESQRADAHGRRGVRASLIQCQLADLDRGQIQFQRQRRIESESVGAFERQ